MNKGGCKRPREDVMHSVRVAVHKFRKDKIYCSTATAGDIGNYCDIPLARIGMALRYMRIDGEIECVDLDGDKLRYYV